MKVIGKRYKLIKGKYIQCTPNQVNIHMVRADQFTAYFLCELQSDIYKDILTLYYAPN